MAASPYYEHMTGTAAAYPNHDCYQWNHQHYLIRPEYVARQCGTCEAITGFRWRSKWRRILSLFTSDLPKPTFGNTD